jgi:hydroxyethylthiazole kinase
LMRTQLAELLSTLRKRKPLVHHITNLVVTNYTANGTLALGASPVMTAEPLEAAQMVRHAQALVLNIGTVTERSAEAMRQAGQEANRLNIPIILDPVGYGATAYRNEIVDQLLKACDISVVRGNAAEIAALCGVEWAQKGVDAGYDNNDNNDKIQLAHAFVQQYGNTVAITGKTDIVSNGKQTVLIEGGDPLLPYITGSGCLASAIIGAYHGVSSDATLAAVAGLATMSVAAERAAQAVSGPGELNWRLLDALYRLKPEQLGEQAQITLLK